VPPEDPDALASAIEAVLDGRADVDLAAARRYAARFHPERVAAHYAGLYRRLLGGRGSARIAA
jgi:glycosyltransferase involved in cell wall biosynthesis